MEGKTKKDFEKWYNRDIDMSNLGICQEFIDGIKKDILLRFYIVSKSMQWGILVNYYGDHDIHISVEPYYDLQGTLVFKAIILGHPDISEQTSYTKRRYAEEDVLKRAEVIREQTIDLFDALHKNMAEAGKKAGELRRDFEDWLNSSNLISVESVFHLAELNGHSKIEIFSELSESMQWGVYVEYYLDKKIDILKFFYDFYRIDDFTVKMSRKKSLRKSSKIRKRQL